MNNFRWLTSLFNFNGMNTGIFNKRRNNRGMMFSVLGLGVGALATYGMTRMRGNKIAPAIVQTMRNRF
ncbi:hypothetical protein FZC66_08155 [Priestia megaterium]|nr:hypothetical protein FZC66_08155 [Priestia megaterium]